MYYCNARHPPSDLQERATKQRAIVLSKMARPKQWTVQHPQLQYGRPQATVTGLSDINAHEGNYSLVSYPAMKFQASSFKKAQFVATTKSKRSHRASPSDVENAPRRECMTMEQLKILNPYYEKNPRPTADDIELLAKEIHRPIQKVVNWFNNRRAKERRLQRHSPPRPSPLSQSLSMNVDSDADMTEPDDEGSESESDADQDDLDCVAAMAQMSRKEIDVAFILTNLKRRIIVRPSEERQIDVFSSV
ncbi:hypothetical protein DFH29DRAFT_1078329 [Suillus ampliporus]|nr:hypothetical protein DFH29DRAFT_1078329 [Suillus ampliporus]